MKNILISCENEQELSEIILVIEEVKRKKPYWNFIFFNTSAIFNRNNIYNMKVFNKVYHSINPFNRNFKNLSLTKKISVITKNTSLIKNIFKKENIDLFLTGVPLSFFRFTHITSQKKPIYISFIRSILIEKEFSHSISDKIHKISKKIPVINRLDMFNSWHSDFIVTIGNINKHYFLIKGIPEKKIIISGPLLLDYYKNKKDKKQSKIPTLYLLTSAFKWHNDSISHEEQKKLIEKVITVYFKKYESRFNLIFRPHPRDNVKEYQHLIEKYNLPISKSNFPEFIKETYDNDIIISAISSLNLEWEYLGRKSIFLTSTEIYKRNKNFYKTLEIKPYFSIEEVFKTLTSNNIETNTFTLKNINNIFYSHKIPNYKFLSNFIIKTLEKQRRNL